MNLFSSIKAIFVKSNFRQNFFCEETNLKFLPKVVITKWGTWLTAANYFATNFLVIKQFIKKLDDSLISNVQLKSLIKNVKILGKQLFEVSYFICFS